VTVTGGNKFSQVPEWVLDADISDGAFRLYAALLRYADQDTGHAYPARSTLATRLRKTPKSIDRYLKELSEIGALKAYARFENGQQKSNNYTVVTRNPNAGGATQMSPPSDRGGDTDVPRGATATSPLGATQMSHRTTPNERHPMNEESAANATRPEPAPEDDVIQGELIPSDDTPKPSNKSLEQLATEDAYEKTGKAFAFVPVRQMVKWLIHDRGLPPEVASQAVVMVYEMGKPITKQVLGQLIDGHIRTGSNQRPTTTDRITETARLIQEMEAEQQRRIA
jgi:hypothetical protein